MPNDIANFCATRNGDSKEVLAFESASNNNEQSIHSNYRSSQDTLDKPEEDGSKHTLELETSLLTPAEQEILVPTSPTKVVDPMRLEEVVPEQPEEEDNRVPTPRLHEPIPEPEWAEEDDNMLYLYPKYQDEPDAEAHLRTLR